MIGAVPLGGPVRGFDDETRADAATPMLGSRVHGLEPTPPAGDDQAAAAEHLAARRVKRDKPGAAPSAKQGAQVAEPSAGEVALLLFGEGFAAGGNLQLHDLLPVLTISSVGMLERSDSDVSVLARVGAKPACFSDEAHGLLELEAPWEELFAGLAELAIGAVPRERAMANARIDSELRVEEPLPP